MARIKARKKIASSLLSAILGFSVGVAPSLAGDPFRSHNARQIGDKTETAFERLFLLGNYKGAKQDLISATASEANEPLAHALMGAIAYTEMDWENLKIQAHKTLTAATAIQMRDPMRGNLYLAVGHLLAGAYQYEKQGAIAALTRLQQVLHHFDLAEKIDSDDPELNLLKGYLELMLAVNLPFSSPEKAIARFQKLAAPNYLVTRGIALAYRDLKKFDKALQYTDKALAQTPKNPELIYLKGQILRAKSLKNQDMSLLQEALGYFNKALTKSYQLPDTILEPIQREHRHTVEQLEKVNTKD